MLFSVLIAVLITSGIMPLGIRILNRLGVTDSASARSSHQGVAVRGTGIVLLLGFLGGLVSSNFSLDEGVIEVAIISVVTVAAAILGLVEDIIGIPILFRLLSQLLIAVVFGFLLFLIFDTSLLEILISVLIIVSYINMSNFMDGLNGMSGLHGFVVGALFLTIGLVTDLSWLAVSGAVMACVFTSFLPWNLMKAGTFLGDSGSYLLGCAHAAIACLAVVSGIPVLAAFAGAVIYVADTVWTIIVRIQRGERLAESHRMHVYQQLNDFGFGHLSTSLIIAGFTIITSGLGLFALSGTLTASIWSLSLMLVISMIYLALPKIIEKSRNRAGAERTGRFLEE